MEKEHIFTEQTPYFKGFECLEHDQENQLDIALSGNLLDTQLNSKITSSNRMWDPGHWKRNQPNGN